MRMICTSTSTFASHNTTVNLDRTLDPQQIYERFERSAEPEYLNGPSIHQLEWLIRELQTRGLPAYYTPLPPIFSTPTSAIPITMDSCNRQLNTLLAQALFHAILFTTVIPSDRPALSTVRSFMLAPFQVMWWLAGFFLQPAWLIKMLASVRAILSSSPIPQEKSERTTPELEIQQMMALLFGAIALTPIFGLWIVLHWLTEDVDCDLMSIALFLAIFGLFSLQWLLSSITISWIFQRHYDNRRDMRTRELVAFHDRLLASPMGLTKAGVDEMEWEKYVELCEKFLLPVPGAAQRKIWDDLVREERAGLECCAKNYEKMFGMTSMQADEKTASK